MKTEKPTLADVQRWQAGAELDGILEGLLGDDLQTRDTDIIKIVGDWFDRLPKQSEDVPNIWEFAGFTKRDENGDTDPNRWQDYFLWLWETRDDDGGKPYAPALEAAKDKYRRPSLPFSTCPVAMMELFAHMKAHGFSTDLSNEVDFAYTGGVWCCGFYNGHSWDCVQVSSHAETLPLAVTRAAIAALWNEEKGGQE